ncbi:MAG TPA: hypothetical protein VNY24_22540 [Candidatus Acidoferrales bacterium]|jgi:hypothetical protein|nr:hypothetical protein [Candidatus Acidoferrales bacterium]
MRANTVEIGVRTDKFTDISVEKRTYRCDPYEVKDGRYVGHDGFVVPKDFSEFYQRFPNYVRQWVTSHVGRSASEQDVEDWTQELLIHLFRLPVKSVHREAGNDDIIQTFDPAKHYGANEARFRNYVNLCLMNKFRTMYSRRMKDALCRPNKLSIDGTLESDSSVTAEFCHSNSTQWRETARTHGRQAVERVLVQDFLHFVGKHDRRILSVVEALLKTETQTEAANALGLTENEFARIRRRLDKLRNCFLTGEPVPKRWRPYRRRLREDLHTNT